MEQKIVIPHAVKTSLGIKKFYMISQSPSAFKHRFKLGDHLLLFGYHGIGILRIHSGKIRIFKRIILTAYIHIIA